MCFQSDASVFKFLCSVHGGTEREREKDGGDKTLRFSKHHMN